MAKDPHFALVTKGVQRHDLFKYAQALPYFDRALALAPDCPSALYNRANTLSMLDRDKEAHDILLGLVASTEEELWEACPLSVETPRSNQLDAYYLLFCTSLSNTGSWRRSTPFLREHLKRRCRGLRSLWSKATVLRQVEAYRLEYAPRAKPIS